MRVYAPIDAETLEGVGQQAKRAEALGFDGVFVPELKLDPFLTSVLCAEHTRKVKVSTDIALAFPRSPMTTAYMAWALQRFSAGRFELGLGTQVKGHIERRFSAAWDSPGPRLKEYVRSLRSIWECWQKGIPLNFRGKFYNFTLMTPFFTPGPIDHPEIPIGISAVNTYNLQTAGEVCDSVRLHGFCTYKYVTEVVLPNLEEGASKAGRALKDLEVSGGGFVITGADEEELARGMEEVRGAMAFYGSTRTYKPVMDVHGWGEVTLQLHQLSLKGAWEEMPHLITDEMVETFSAIGTYDRIADAIKARFGDFATQAALRLPRDDPASEEQVRQAIKALQST
ncbi:MAG: TIGR03617 family F420-dependent LLM class oxidoreductase [Dehalococcoidia bacterium]